MGREREREGGREGLRERSKCVSLLAVCSVSTFRYQPQRP